MKNWKETKNIPKDVKELGDKIVPPDKESHDEVSEEYVVPEIYVRTAPAELIETFGKPEYSSLDGTNLLYVKNSESEIIMDITSQNHFILISGRWYKSKSLSGNWEYVDAAKLPEDFSKIPPESTMGSVLVSVPGTEQAKEAVLDTQIPQTAEVDRTFPPSS